MGYTNFALKEKIMQMYPEIGERHLSLELVFSGEKNAYIITLGSDQGTLTTHLDKDDADACMNNIRCVHLGIQVGQFVKNLAARREFERNAA